MKRRTLHSKGGNKGLRSFGARRARPEASGVCRPEWARAALFAATISRASYKLTLGMRAFECSRRDGALC